MLLVWDTDVVPAGVVSATGASRFLLESVGLGVIAAAASVPVPLFLEQDFAGAPMRFGIEVCRPAEIARRVRAGWLHKVPGQ
jgi:hypothetical protein